MNFEAYQSLIVRKLKKNLIFNILNNIEEHGMKIDLFADCIFLSNEIIISKALPFNKYEIYEKYYVKHYNDINVEDVQNFFNFLKFVSNNSLKSDTHLQKSIIGIMAGNMIDGKCISIIEGLNYSKPYTMYFKGWSEIQLICVDLSANKIFYNNAAEKSTQLFIPDIHSPAIL